MDTGGAKGSVKSDINVTPLVDIVLVLLIIFIVITPAVNDAVRLPLSKHSIKPEKEVGAKYLSLMLPATTDPKTGAVVPGLVQVDDQDAKELRFSFADTANREKLIKFVKSNVDRLQADRRVFIKADASLPYKHVNELFQICREAGADEASVVTSEDKSGEKKK